MNPDFYKNLSVMENEAMRRARKIHDAEQNAAAHFHASPPEHEAFPTHHREHQNEPPAPHTNAGGFFGSGLFHSSLFSSPDFSLIMMLFFILQAENSDPLLLLALMYILM